MSTPKKMTTLICVAIGVCTLLGAAPAEAQGVSFIARRDFDVGMTPYSVAVGDFNGDGVQDLVVAPQYRG